MRSSSKQLVAHLYGWATRERSRPGAWVTVSSSKSFGLCGILHLSLGSCDAACALESAEPPFTAPDVSPYRRFDWISLDLDEVKAVKNALGGAIHDVVLATTTGGIRRFLEARDIDVDSIGGFRAFLPANTRNTGGVSTGNQVAMLLAELPVSEPGPSERR